MRPGSDQVPGGQYETGLFNAADGLHGSTEGTGAAAANLDKYQRPPIFHHQVDFPETAIEISRDQAQAARQQVTLDAPFDPATDTAIHRLSDAPLRTSPLTTLAHSSLLATRPEPVRYKVPLNA